MKRQPIERYGFGPRLQTRSQRLACAALELAVAIIILAVLVWCAHGK